jgi:hypothetical protein
MWNRSGAGVCQISGGLWSHLPSWSIDVRKKADRALHSHPSFGVDKVAFDRARSLKIRALLSFFGVPISASIPPTNLRTYVPLHSGLNWRLLALWVNTARERAFSAKPTRLVLRSIRVETQGKDVCISDWTMCSWPWHCTSSSNWQPQASPDQPALPRTTTIYSEEPRELWPHLPEEVLLVMLTFSTGSCTSRGECITRLPDCLSLSHHNTSTSFPVLARQVP